MESNLYPTWLEINLSAVEKNTRTVLEKTAVSLMAVVKANAYGMGAVEISQAMLSAGASYLAVARACEAMALRNAGIHCPILVFGLPTPAEMDELISAKITLSLTGFEAADLFASHASTLRRVIKVHLKVDTGMGRFGVFSEEALPLAKYTLQRGGVEIEGIYTHFAMIDTGPEDPLNRLQLSRFQDALSSLQQAGIQPRWIHAANSAAALGHPETRFNMTRAGSAMVGIRPFYYLPFPKYLRRVLTWKTQLVSCRTLPAGWGVSYGQTYHTQGEEMIGIIPAGYADGFRRSPTNEVILENQRIPVVGKVCADMSMLRLPKPYPLGTEILLLGEQHGQVIQIEDLSERWNVSQADVTAAITSRVQRVYVRD